MSSRVPLQYTLDPHGVKHRPGRDPLGFDHVNDLMRRRRGCMDAGSDPGHEQKLDDPALIAGKRQHIAGDAGSASFRPALVPGVCKQFLPGDNQIFRDVTCSTRADFRQRFGAQ